jgi:putative protease
VGLVEELQSDGSAVIAVRNRIRVGDELEFIGPGMRSTRLTVDRLRLLDQHGRVSEEDSVNPNQRILMKLPFTVEPLDLIRREKPGAA